MFMIETLDGALAYEQMGRYFGVDAPLGLRGWWRINIGAAEASEAASWTTCIAARARRLRRGL